MDTEGLIDITGVDLVRLTQEAYALSAPQGMGFMHFTPDPLSLEEAGRLVRDDGRVALSLDYVRGRAVKLVVWRDGDRLTMRSDWYDHSQEQLRELLNRVKVSA